MKLTKSQITSCLFEFKNGESTAVEAMNDIWELHTKTLESLKNSDNNKITKTGIECVFHEVVNKEVTHDQGVNFIWGEFEKLQKEIAELKSKQ